MLYKSASGVVIRGNTFRRFEPSSRDEVNHDGSIHWQLPEPSNFPQTPIEEKKYFMLCAANGSAAQFYCPLLLSFHGNIVAAPSSLHVWACVMFFKSFEIIYIHENSWE